MLDLAPCPLWGWLSLSNLFTLQFCLGMNREDQGPFIRLHRAMPCSMCRTQTVRRLRTEVVILFSNFLVSHIWRVQWRLKWEAKSQETCQETRQEVLVKFDNDTTGLSTTLKTCEATIPCFLVPLMNSDKCGTSRLDIQNLNC